MMGYIQKSTEHFVTALLSRADIRINGRRPWDITLKNDSFFDRIASCGSLALGESYMDGWWDCEALDQFFFKLLRNRVDHKAGVSTPLIISQLKAWFFNCQNRRKAFDVGEKHYDIGNDLFEHMLDGSMAYSCGYWKEAANLDEAQTAKMDMICRKLQLAPGMKLLDIGCGWGSLVGYAAKNYGVEAVGITVSAEQAALARERCRGLPVTIRLQDYRDVAGTFDAVVSVGMFEHVGYKNYKTFMNVVRRCLSGEGLFLLHTIAANRTTRHCDPWFDKYIFPNGMLPSIKQIGTAMEKLFVMEDWHNIGTHYDRTLMAWHENVRLHWPRLRERYGERFYRMWCYYLLSLAGGFRARHIQVWQVVLSPDGRVGGYPSLRCPECTS